MFLLSARCCRLNALSSVHEIRRGHPAPCQQKWEKHELITPVWLRTGRRLILDALFYFSNFCTFTYMLTTKCSSNTFTYLPDTVEPVTHMRLMLNIRQLYSQVKEKRRAMSTKMHAMNECNRPTVKRNLTVSQSASVAS